MDYNKRKGIVKKKTDELIKKYDGIQTVLKNYENYAAEITCLSPVSAFLYQSILMSKKIRSEVLTARYLQTKI